MLKKLSFILCLLCSAGWIQAATFTVSNTNSIGTGSLAQAIIDANNAGTGPHTIAFSISNVTIASPSVSYTISNSGITIDGTGKNIIISGATSNVGMYISSASNTTIKGLTFNSCTTYGISIASSTNTTIVGCRFNTTTTGSAAVGYSSYCIWATACDGIVLGGSAAGEGNYIGVGYYSQVTFSNCSNVTVKGNSFGVSTASSVYSSTYTIPYNLQFANTTTNVKIGGSDAERNLFAGATGASVSIAAGASNVSIINNYFGYNATKSTSLTYANGISIASATTNRIMYNSFATTAGTPFNVSTSDLGTVLRMNSFENHNGNPSNTIMNVNATQPIIYSATTSIIKGVAHPGDSIEIYYANAGNSTIKSGKTLIAAVLADATTGRWQITGAYTSGQIIAVNATNNTNKTTTWFTNKTVTTCTNTPSISTSGIPPCHNKAMETTGMSMSGYGSVGTTNPSNAGIWSSMGGGTFTNGAAYYAPTITYYHPTPAELAANQATFKLTTTDTTCVNGPGATATLTFNIAPAFNAGADFYSCANTVTMNSTPVYAGNPTYYLGWSTLDYPSDVSITGASTDNPTITFSASAPAGDYRMVHNVMKISGYCSNSDTVVVTYKPTPTAPNATITTSSQVPVTYTVPTAPGEVLIATCTTSTVTPSTSIVTNSGNSMTYKSTGTFYGTGSYTYSVQNACGNYNTSGGNITVIVQNAAPKAIPVAPVSTIRGQQNTVILRITDYVTDVNGIGDINMSSVLIAKLPMSYATCIFNTPSVGYITVDYSTSQAASDFVGLDSMTFQISDSKPNTTQFKVTIDRGRNLSNPSATPDEIVVHNGISPDGDGVNDYLTIVNLADYRNTVTIYDRWGDKVWVGENYNNTSVRFEGNGNVANYNPLPSGTYFYVIKNKSRSENDEKSGLSSGYLIIKREQ